MKARISIIGTDILCQCDSAGQIADVRIPLTNESLTRITDWIGRYTRVVRSGDPSTLPGLGVEMFDWLDGTKWASGWATKAGERELEIAVDALEHESARALLDLPWETLARKSDFLAADDVQSRTGVRSFILNLAGRRLGNSGGFSRIPDIIQDFDEELWYFQRMAGLVNNRIISCFLQHPKRSECGVPT